MLRRTPESGAPTTVEPRGEISIEEMHANVLKHTSTALSALQEKIRDTSASEANTSKTVTEAKMRSTKIRPEPDARSIGTRIKAKATQHLAEATAAATSMARTLEQRVFPRAAAEPAGRLETALNSFVQFESKGFMDSVDIRAHGELDGEQHLREANLAIVQKSLDAMAKSNDGASADLDHTLTVMADAMESITRAMKLGTG